MIINNITMNLPNQTISQESIKNILDYNNFVIPFYQRDYSWSFDQIKLLLDDLYNAYENPIKDVYYIGTIMGITYERNINYREDFRLFDGRQRLTTILEILRIICKIGHNNQELLKNNNKSTKYIRRIEELFYIVSSRSGDEFDNCEDCSKMNYLSKILVENGNKTLSNYKYFSQDTEDKIEKYLTSKMESLFKKDGFLQYLLNDVIIIFHKFVAFDYKNYKNEVELNIIQLFLNMNTKGKRFDDEDLQEVLRRLKNDKTNSVIK